MWLKGLENNKKKNFGFEALKKKIIICDLDTCQAVWMLQGIEKIQ